MKLLVTGGAGFIGSNFINYWLKRFSQDRVINLDALTYAGNLDNLQPVITNPRYQFVHGDIGDKNIVNYLVKQVDLIVNFAAETHVDRSIKSSAEFIKTNVDGVRVLLDAVKAKGQTRFHQVSTDEVFGSLNLTDRPFDENSPYRPRSPYSASKAAADHLVRAYHHTFGLPITITYCSNNYGPWQHPEKFIPLFITKLLQNQPAPLYGTGKNIRDWIHVLDHCRGLEAVILKGRLGSSYCLGGNNELSNSEIAGRLLKILGKSKKLIQPVADRPGHDLRYALNIGKIKRELGFRPQMDFVAGLSQTVKWYQAHQGWWRGLRT